MRAKDIYDAYIVKKEIFHRYIYSIKQNAYPNIFTIINPTLITNPYVSTFPKKFFFDIFEKRNKYLLFIQSLAKYLFFNYSQLAIYFISFILYKIYFKKQSHAPRNLLIDVFVLVNTVNKANEFKETYFPSAYNIFEKYSINYTLLLRLYGIGKNPFKLVKFFQILSNDKNDFLIEFELVTLKDLLEIFWLILVTPLQCLKFLQHSNTRIDKIFNEALIEDIAAISFESFTRYILGKRVARISSVKTIYSWSEFQVVDRSFNFGIRSLTDSIKLMACHFYLNYETYFNAYVDDLDYDMLSSPHEVYVNGPYYLLKRKKIAYKEGVALRYQGVFDFIGIKNERYTLILGSYIVEDTKKILECAQYFSDVLFKHHPITAKDQALNLMLADIKVVNDNIYTLFENTKIVITTASGTAVEAVSCGISVIIVASENNLTANPLVEYGKGKIWDIAFDSGKIASVYEQLVEYRNHNKQEIQTISTWYKENFFIEPTEANIVRVFGLKKEYNR